MKLKTLNRILDLYERHGDGKRSLEQHLSLVSKGSKLGLTDQQLAHSLEVPIIYVLTLKEALKEE